MAGRSTDPTTGAVEPEHADADPGIADRLQSHSDTARSPSRPICRRHRPPARRQPRLRFRPISMCMTALGTMHTVTLKWQLNPVAVGRPAVPANNWTVNDSIPDDAAFTGSADVTFGTGAAGGCRPAPSSAMDTPTGNVTVGAAYNAGNPAAQPASLTLHRRFRLRPAADHNQSRQLRQDQRRHAICRHRLQPARD